MQAAPKSTIKTYLDIFTNQSYPTAMDKTLRRHEWESVFPTSAAK